MKNQNDWKDTARLVSKMSHVTGFGISLITSILLPIWGGMWLQERFGFGDWVVIVALLCGLTSAGLTFYHFVTDELKRAKREEAEYLRAREERTNMTGSSDTKDET